MPGIFVTSLSSPSLAIWIWECITHPQFEPQNDVSFAESRGQRKTPGWQDRALSLTGFVPIGRKTVPASPADHLGRVYRCNPTSAAARQPIAIIKPVRDCIRTRVGNKLGTVLAT